MTEPRRTPPARRTSRGTYSIEGRRADGYAGWRSTGASGRIEPAGGDRRTERRRQRLASRRAFAENTAASTAVVAWPIPYNAQFLVVFFTRAHIGPSSISRDNDVGEYRCREIYEWML